MLKRVLPGAACLVTLLATGCAFSGNGVVSTANGGGSSPLRVGSMGGVAHGGRQGIYGATVSLYSMGTAGYGTSTLVAQTTTRDANGDFNFFKGADGSVTSPNTSSGWSCPSGATSGTPGTATDPYIYAVVAGGDTSGAATPTSLTPSSPTTSSAGVSSTFTVTAANGTNIVSGAVAIAVGSGTTHTINFNSASTLSSIAAAINADTTFSGESVTASYNSTTFVMTITGPATASSTLVTTGTTLTQAPSTTQSNTYSNLLAVLGDCASINGNTYVTVNEGTTVASMVGLQQFFNPMTQAIGTSSSNITGLTNAVNMVNGNLVNTYNGEIRASTSYSNTTASSTAYGITVTANPESSKLTTMANILASCVSINIATNPGSNNCSTLAANAVPPTTAPTVTSGYATTETAAYTNFSSITTYPAVNDTLQAINYMMINPTNSQDYGSNGKLANLFALSSPGSTTTPYQTPTPLASTAKPMDWTVGINFTYAQSSGGPYTSFDSGTTYVGCNVSVTQTTTTPAATNTVQVPWMFDLYYSAVDKYGNLWFSGYGGTVGSSTQSSVPNAVFELSPLGAPMQCLETNNAAGGNSAGRQMSFDSQGNLWWVTNQGFIEFILDPSNGIYAGAGVTPAVLTWPIPTGYSGSAVAADQNGNVFVTPYAITTGTATMNILEYVAVASASSIPVGFTPTAIGNTLLSTTPVPYRNLTVNKAGDLVTEGSGATGGYAYAYQPSTNGSAVGGYLDSKVTTTNGASSPYGMAVDLNGYSVGGNTTNARAGGLYRIDPTALSGTTVGTMKNYSPLGAGGNGVDRSTAVDGAGNIWTGGAIQPNDSTGTLNSVGETDTNYYAISPEGSAASSCSGAPCAAYGGYMKSFNPYETASGMPINVTAVTAAAPQTNNMWNLAIDSSGNVWGFEGSSLSFNYFVIVGQAVPVTTPVAANLLH